MTKNPAKKNGTSHIVREIIISVLLSVAVSFVFLLIFCTIAYRTDNPNKYIRPLSYVTLGISALICGFISSKKIGMSSLICGLIGGFIYAVIMFIASLPIENQSGRSLGFNILVYIAVILLSAVGGIIGGARKISGKHRRYRR